MSLSISDAIATVTGSAVMDLTKITAIVQAIIAAAPAVEQGIVDIDVYVSAIATMIKNGGQPTDAEWAALEAALDAGSAQLQSAATQAASEIQQAADPAAQTQE